MYWMWFVLHEAEELSGRGCVHLARCDHRDLVGLGGTFRDLPGPGRTWWDLPGPGGTW